MDATTATDFITANKGAEVTILLNDGTELTGEAFSVNSKGVNIKVDGKTKSVSLSRIDDFTSELDEDDELADETDEDIYAMLSDGMTTAELADELSNHLNVSLTPKELRVHLRALGLGVGKGRKYSLSATEYRMVKDLVVTNA